MSIVFLVIDTRDDAVVFAIFVLLYGFARDDQATANLNFVETNKAAFGLYLARTPIMAHVVRRCHKLKYRCLSTHAVCRIIVDKILRILIFHATIHARLMMASVGADRRP